MGGGAPLKPGTLTCLPVSPSIAQALVWCEVGSGVTRVTGQVPHIIIVAMLDDLGKAEAFDPSLCPNIGRLRSEGRDFRNAWSMGLCVPSRATLLSGMYPARTGWMAHWAHWEHEQSPTLLTGGVDRPWSRLLHEAGWRTVVAGKWQLGDAARGGSTAMEALGWDRWAVWDGDVGSGNRYYGQTVHIGARGAGQRTCPIDRFSEDLFLGTILEEIHAAAHAAQPVAMYYPLLLPHRPIVTVPGGPTEGSNQQLFRAMVRAADAIIGALRIALITTGLAQRAVLIVTSDNGTHGSGKGELSERGISVPFVGWGPGIVAASETGALVDFTDILPTLCALAERQAPAGIDGHSFAPVLTGTGDTSRTTAISMGLGGLRDQGDGLLKAADWPHGRRVARRRRYKLLEDETTVWDLWTDTEATNGRRALANMQEALARLPAQDHALPARPTSLIA